MQTKILNIIADFINKDICPYCGKNLIQCYPNINSFDVKCEQCDSYFRFIDSPGPDGYYLPRELESTDYFYTLPRDIHGNILK